MEPDRSGYEKTGRMKFQRQRLIEVLALVAVVALLLIAAWLGKWWG